jgi:hypothetical protein
MLDKKTAGHHHRLQGEILPSTETGREVFRYENGFQAKRPKIPITLVPLF